MRYKQDNKWYNLIYTTITPFTSITVKQQIKRSIRHAIIVDNIFGLHEFDEIPSVNVNRKNRYEYTVKIRNTGNKHDVIQSSHMALSGALRHRLSRFEFSQAHDINGANWLEFQVNDMLANWQFRPSVINNFKNKFGIVKIDNRLSIDITKSSHFVISGSTGTGKSTFFMSTLAQMLLFTNGKNKPDIYIVDFKNGELGRLAKQSRLPKGHFVDGTNSDELLAMFEHIDKLMFDRQQAQLKEKSLTITAKDLGYAPIYVVLEEAGSGLALLDKKVQDKVKNYIGKIAMQGRSSLVILSVLSQQASVQGTGLSTAIITQLSNKVLLGQTMPTERAYLMPGFDLPDKAWPKGSGRGYFFSDSLLQPYEFTGAFPSDELNDSWLFRVLCAEINAIYR